MVSHLLTPLNQDQNKSNVVHPLISIVYVLKTIPAQQQQQQQSVN